MVDNTQCTGCTLCYAVCPVGAIVMELDDIGFFRPVVNENACIKCGACNRQCPISNYDEQTSSITESACYYCFNEDMGERIRSTSGGVFFLLAEQTIRDEGIVCGCVWDEGFEGVTHVCTDSLETVKGMRGSKYMQSNLGESLREIKEHLRLGRKVLFSGTGCQTDAVRRFTDDPENLVTCGVICGGVPSVKVWKLYKRALEKKTGSKISDVHMRSKYSNWFIPNAEILFSNGKAVREVLLGQNLYGSNFGWGLLQMESCMNCHFRGDHINADIIISDHWGITSEFFKKSENKGASSVVVRTNKGRALFEQIKPKMYVEHGNAGDIIKSHHVMTQNHAPNNKREYFFRRLKEDPDIISLLSECLPNDKKSIIKRNAVLNKMRIYIPMATMKWKIEQKLNRE